MQEKRNVVRNGGLKFFDNEEEDADNGLALFGCSKIDDSDSDSSSDSVETKD